MRTPLMQIEQIFSGHALDLRRIVAVSNVMMDSRPQANQVYTDRTMYLEIHCEHGTVLRHNQLIQTVVIGMVQKKEVKVWRDNYEELSQKRYELLMRWSEVTGNSLLVSPPAPVLEKET